MTPERYLRLDELCHQALSRPPAERPAFVRAACGGDETLRRELESLLDASDQAGEFLEDPPDDLAAALLQDLRDEPLGLPRTLGHYVLRSRLGAGGMGEVYLADDSTLGRQVALKLLPPGAATDGELRRRFVREAHAASALSHPNVAHIYEIGDSAGVQFIAMEYVPGTTLGALLKERSLPAAEAIAIAIQIVDALEEAHAKGVVHRDIKPANVMITPRGQAKVLDFGIAKLTAAKGAPTGIGDASLHTEPGLRMGTVGYMSPEQALGLAVDERSDIYSTGVLLNEMLVGASVPARVQAVVQRCLAPDPAQRYPTARELLAELRALSSGPAPRARWRKPVVAAGAALCLAAAGFLALRPAGRDPRAAAAPTATRVKLAVLPFENLGGAPDREYLAAALTEETIAALGQLDPERLGVIGRRSVMPYKQTTKTVSQIGRELDAAYVVECSIRSEASRWRVIAKLTRSADQVQLWSAAYDSEPTSMLAFQRELGTTIAEQIRLTLSPERLDLLARRQTRSPEAYDLYLRGRDAFNQSTPATTRRAVEYFSRATTLDPNYALAWSGLADAYSASPMTGDAPPLKVWPLARHAAAEAVRAEPGLAEAQASLGFVEFWLDWKWPDAEASFRKAAALDPNYAFPHRMLGILFSHQGRVPEARQEMQRARELEPLYAMHHALSCQVAFVGRDFPAAIAFGRQAILVDPLFWIAHFCLAQTYEQQGLPDKALEEIDVSARLSGGNSKAPALRGYILARQGKTREARATLEALERAARTRYVPPYALALVHLGLGEPDAAMDFLERGLAVRDPHLAFMTIDPKWDGLRSNARYRDLLRRCGLPEPFAPAVR